jgi:hypothetical protein
LPETKQFVALGHGIVDSDSENLLEIEAGAVTTTDVISVVKGSSRKSSEKLEAQ